jgi:sucrose-6-phosphate hydrolase SacC (GH32 family)
MKRITATIATLLLWTATLGAQALPDTARIRVEHLGETNTLVRVEGQAHYLLMPVQESIEDARVDVVVDGQVERTIYVRLAMTKVDYQVPFDLTPYRGHNLLLNVVTQQSRTSIRDSKYDACWKNLTLSDTFDTTNREHYRPAYHHTPLYGWMNDPNGMVYLGGTWHLYYQSNPYGSKWQNMTWGHSTSTDLLHWQHQPLALEPDGLGAIFSGSSVLDPRGTAGFGEEAIVTLYTSAGESQMQSLAHSRDGGQTFEKFAGNPVITLDSEARDPNMFWYAPTSEWILLLAHAQEHEMLIFASPDLQHWTLRSSFGKGLGAQDGVWECPDMFELPLPGTDRTKWVLLCNINPGGSFGGSATQYFVGDFDGTTFTPDRNAKGKVPTKWMDYGKDHYATVTFSDAPDARRVALGWMSNWQYAAEVPTRQFRSANTLPRDLSLFTAADGQVYLASTPSPEVERLRAPQHTTKTAEVNLTKKPQHFKLPTANDGICEILLEVSGSVTATLSNAEGERCVITYDEADHAVSFDRRKSGLTDFSQDFPAVTVAPVRDGEARQLIHLYVDRSSIEAFGTEGRWVMTNLVFPTTPYTQLSLSASGHGCVHSLTIYPLLTADGE